MTQPRTAPALLGLCGGPAAGKDTTAGLLVQHYGFRPHAFADSLRNFLYATDDGWRMMFDAYGYEQAKITQSGGKHGFRDRMVEIGEAAREWISPTVWIDSLAEKAGADLEAGFSVVVSDVRYLNEAEMIREFGGLVVGIDRPGHMSETDEAWEVFIGADDWLFNDGPISDLEIQIEVFVRALAAYC